MKRTGMWVAILPLLMAACGGGDARDDLGQGTDAVSDHRPDSAVTDSAAGDAASCEGVTPPDDSMDGMYRVTLHQKKQPCEGEFKDVGALAQSFKVDSTFLLQAQEVLPCQWMLMKYDCTGATEDTCDKGTPKLFESPVWYGQDWQYVLTATMFTDACNMTVTRGTLETTEDGLRLETTARTAKSTEVTTQEGCTSEYAAAYPTESMACVFVEVIEADRI
mgnify:CR=1 FL=1